MLVAGMLAEIGGRAKVSKSYQRWAGFMYLL